MPASIRIRLRFRARIVYSGYHLVWLTASKSRMSPSFMVRTYEKKNRWRDRAHLSEAQVDEIFFSMLRGQTIRQISETIDMPILTVRDNYNFLLRNVFRHNVAEFIFGFINANVPQMWIDNNDLMPEWRFWHDFPLITKDEFRKCIFNCAFSPSLAEISNNENRKLLVNAIALSRTANCNICPIKNIRKKSIRNFRLKDRASFFEYLKRTRGIISRNDLVCHIELFKCIKLVSFYNDWLKSIYFERVIEIMRGIFAREFSAYNVSLLLSAVKDVCIGLVASGRNPSSDIECDMLGGWHAAGVYVGREEIGVAHYRSIIRNTISTQTQDNLVSWKKDDLAQRFKVVNDPVPFFARIFRDVL